MSDQTPDPGAGGRLAKLVLGRTLRSLLARVTGVAGGLWLTSAAAAVVNLDRLAAVGRAHPASLAATGRIDVIALAVAGLAFLLVSLTTIRRALSASAKAIADRIAAINQAAGGNVTTGA